MPTLKEFAKDEKRYVREVPVEERAFCVLAAEKPTPEVYRFLPAMCWPQNGAINLAGFVLTHISLAAKAALVWTIPWKERNQVRLVRLLTHLGWDGRVWPGSEGWPDNSPEEKEGLQNLMRRQKVEATLTFPPGAEGNSTIDLPVIRRALFWLDLPELPEVEGEEERRLFMDGLVEADPFKTTLYTGGS